MQKAADMANMSVLFFQGGANCSEHAWEGTETNTVRTALQQSAIMAVPLTLWS